MEGASTCRIQTLLRTMLQCEMMNMSRAAGIRGSCVECEGACANVRQVPDEEEEEEEEKKKKEDPDKEEEEKDPNQPEPSPE